MRSIRRVWKFQNLSKEILLSGQERATAVNRLSDVPGLLPPTEKRRWLGQVAAAIEEASVGAAQTVAGPRTGTLRVCPGVAPDGTELVSADIESDHGRRLANAISRRRSVRP